MTNALNIEDLEQDAKEQTANIAAKFSLEDLLAAGEKLEFYRAEEARISAQLKAVTEDIRELESEILPDAMKNLGLKNFTMTSGAEVILTDVYSASITDSNREEAHAWLRTHGHGDIIKNNVTISFGKGEDEYAGEIINRLLIDRKAGSVKFGDLQQKEAVHPQTLKAFVKDQVTSGEEFPGELFKLYVGQAVKITKQ